MSLILAFTSDAATASQHSGGKGSNLARLTQAGLPVPAGFIVTAEAYEIFAALAQTVLTAADHLTFTDDEVTNRQCEALVNELERVPFPEEVGAALRRHLDEIGDDAPVSVRSSPTTEDLGGAAFAGQHDIGELMAEPLDDRSIPDLWNFVLRVKDLGAEYFLPNIAISITQRTLYRVLHGLLQILAGPTQAPIVFDQLLAHCETKTGAINKELYRFAAQIAEHPPLADELRSIGAADFLRGRGFAEHPELDHRFRRFLRDHGHREVEFDPFQPTWIEDPALVIDNLKVMLDSHLADPAIKEREAKIVMTETEAAVTGQAPAEIRFFVRELIRLARVYTTLDDVEHYQTTRLTIPLRKGLRALGTALQKHGVLNDPMDVFFAPYATLDAAVKSNDSMEWRRLGEAVRQEKQAYDRHRRETPVWEWGVPAVSVDTDDSILTGLPGSPGIASGPVFKVLGSEDFGNFPKGAVLVARTTNPAWTPLFYKAAAVITESGGPLSHGAVTAREIGLPAVMSVRTALVGLTNGQYVTVDGTTGRVHQEKAP